MSEGAEERSPEAVALVELAQAGRHGALESAWMAAIEADRLPLEDLLAVLREVAVRGDRGPLESLAWFLLSEWADRRGAEAALDAARRAGGLLPAGRALRDQVAALYRRAFAAAAGLETLLEMTVLAAEYSLEAGMERLERLLALAPGTYVRDARRRSPGRIVGADAARKGLEVSFGDSSKIYDASSIDNLEVLEADDFRALVLFDRARAAALAESDPAELVRLALRALGPRLALHDLKAHLAPVVPPEAWGRWWKNARPQLKRAAAIEMTEGSRPELILRSRPMAFEDQTRRDFGALASPEERLVFVLAHLAEPVADSAAERAVLGYLARRLAAQADRLGRADPLAALGSRAVLHEIEKRDPAAAPAPPTEADALAADDARLAELLGAVASDALVRCILEYVRDARPAEWPAVYAAALPAVSAAAAEAVVRTLLDEGQGEVLGAAVRAVLKRPADGAGALVWIWRAACGEKPALALAPADRYAAATGLLVAADALKRAAADGQARARRLLPDVQRAIAAREYAALRGVLAEADDDQARAIRVLADRNAGLTDLARARVLDVIRDTHPSLHVTRAAAPWEEDVVYTTDEGLHRQQELFEQVVHVQMAENARAIGAAAGHGDLSENAEFTAALEERDRLAEKATRMQADLAKARLILRSMAEGDRVTVGSAVRARDLATGRVEEFTFLGPWDAEPDKGVYYYRTPLAQAFMGKAPGETALLASGGQERRWEIVEVRPGL